MTSTNVSTRSPSNDCGSLCLPRVAGVYCERHATERLRPWVRRAWGNSLRLAGKQLIIVPGGCIDIVWTGNALLVAGPDTRPSIECLQEDAILAGLRFHPGAARPWLKISAAEITNKRFPLSDLWGSHARQIANQLFAAQSPAQLTVILEQQLLSRTPDERPAYRADHLLRKAIEARLQLRETLIRDLAAELGIAERTIRRRSNELFGYGPKVFARILRFQRFITAVQRADHLPISVLAGQCGYADQAHLSREVRRLSGLTTTEVAKQLASCCDHTIGCDEPKCPRAQKT